MNLDDELCLCFHVTRRKVVNYLRIERPRSVSQLSDCYGAGTGCGWCRPYLKQLFDAAVEPASEGGESAGGESATALPAAAEYARLRTQYVRAGKGQPPPGATPIDDQP